MGPRPDVSHEHAGLQQAVRRATPALAPPAPLAASARGRRPPLNQRVRAANRRRRAGDRRRPRQRRGQGEARQHPRRRARRAPRRGGGRRVRRGDRGGSRWCIADRGRHVRAWCARVRAPAATIGVRISSTRREAVVTRRVRRPGDAEGVVQRPHTHPPHRRVVARLQRRRAPGAHQVNFLLPPDGLIPFPVTPRAAAIPGADPVSTDEHQDVHVAALLHVLQADGALCVVVVLIGAKARQLTAVRRLPGALPVSQRGGCQALSLSAPSPPPAARRRQVGHGDRPSPVQRRELRSIGRGRGRSLVTGRRRGGRRRGRW